MFVRVCRPMPDRDVKTRGRPGNAELFPGRVDPLVWSILFGPGPEYFNIRRVGSGPDGGGSGRVHVPGPDLTCHFMPSLCAYVNF